MSSTAKPCPRPAPHVSLHSSSLSLYHSICPGWTNWVILRAQHISWSILWMFSVWLELKTHFSPSTFSSSFFKLVYFKENLAHVFLIIPNSFALNSSKCCFAKAFCFPRLLKSFFLVLSAYPFTPPLFSPFLSFCFFKGTLFLETGIFCPQPQICGPTVGRAYAGEESGFWTVAPCCPIGALAPGGMCGAVVWKSFIFFLTWCINVRH